MLASLGRWSRWRAIDKLHTTTPPHHHTTMPPCHHVLNERAPPPAAKSGQHAKPPSSSGGRGDDAPSPSARRGVRRGRGARGVFLVISSSRRPATLARSSAQRLAQQWWVCGGQRERCRRRALAAAGACWACRAFRRMSCSVAPPCAPVSGTPAEVKFELGRTRAGTTPHTAPPSSGWDFRGATGALLPDDGELYNKPPTHAVPLATPPIAGPFFRRNFISRGIGRGQIQPRLTAPDL